MNSRTAPAVSSRTTGLTGGLFRGLAAPWRGLAFMVARPALWRYAIVPMVLNLLITGLVLAGLIYAAMSLADWAGGLLGSGWWWRPVEWLLTAGLIVAAIGGAVAAWLALSGVLCGYFYSRLARQVEITLGADPAELREVSLAHEILDTLGDVTALVLGNGLILLLNFVPLIGSLAAIVASALFTSYVLGYDYLAYPLCLRAMRRRERVRYAREHLGHVLGLGAMVLPVTLVPIASSVVLAAAATGAVLLHRDVRLARQGDSPDMPRN